MSAATPAAKISGHTAGMETSGNRTNEPKPKKSLGALWRTRSASDWIIDGIIALIIAAIAALALLTAFPVLTPFLPRLMGLM